MLCLPVVAPAISMADLNSDLGEGESPARTRALMRVVTSANVACGGHAGTPESMDRCVRLAAAFSVRLGAHPGLPGTFGRGLAAIRPGELETLLIHQVSALAMVAKARGRSLEHVKLHGALYHATEQDPALAAAYVRTMRRWFPGLRILALAGGRVAARARASGTPVWEEAFVDRGYCSDGSLVPRGLAGALITSPTAVQRRIRDVRQGLGIETGDGGRWRIRPQTWCVHADTPGAPALARAAAAVLFPEP
ncbi:MAG: LamB/YcsF family protein [Verrucomicrobiales bacterium]|nr:LamB/YcsF family protein [Verrucomicrobiales bacterium]